MPITSPIVPTYASRVPYLTAAEYKASPTGIDVNSLVVNGTTQDNVDALEQTIARASSWVDTECRKIIAATLDTQAGRYRVRPDGTIRVPLDNTPILQVVDVQFGWMPEQLHPLVNLANVWIDKKVATIPVPGFGASTAYAVVHYVNGYANCLLTADASAGDSNIVVDSPLGVVAGQQLTLYDPGSTEQVTVLAVNGDIVTVAAPLTSDHDAGVALSALPPAIKQATVLKTSALIKTRGDDAFVMPALGGEPSEKQATDPGAAGASAVAAELLAPYRRVA